MWQKKACAPSVLGSESPVMHGMQEKSVDAFMHLLDCAVVFEMPKLLACCEHHICIDPKQRFQPMRCSAHYLLPTSSALRIANGLRTAFQMIGNNPYICNIQTCTHEDCRCTGCERFKCRYPRGVDTGKCICVRLSSYMPSSKQFLAMALS